MKINVNTYRRPYRIEGREESKQQRVNRRRTVNRRRERAIKARI